MSMEKIITVASLSLLIAGASFGGYHYKEVHLPSFEKIQADMEYQKCIQRCTETCRANGVPLDRCKCDHCNVFKGS